MASVQIDKDLFDQILDFFLGDSSTEADAELIREQLAIKLDKLIARQLFTIYKTAPTAEERERARKQYLDERGIHPSFRSDDELRDGK